MSTTQILRELTKREDWTEINGPDTRCGTDYHFRNNDGNDAWVNIDQNWAIVAVDGKTIFNGELKQ